MKKYGLRAIYMMLCLLMLWVLNPAAANAQVTVTGVKVQVSGTLSTAVWCSTSVGCGATGGAEIWTLPAGGQTLTGTQTMVLTQTGEIPNVGGNFDTSDRAQSADHTHHDAECSVADPCTVTIWINDMVTPVYTNAGPNPINAGNIDIVDNTSQQEASQYLLAATKPTYTLKIGYADNVHGSSTPVACPASGCFPTPFNGSGGTTAANFFFGASLPSAGQFCRENCYDAGVLLITAVTVPTNLVTVTQGGWGSDPHGNNPGQLLKTNFVSVFGGSGVTIGCAANTMTFLSAAAVNTFLPAGGKPGVLPNAGVFAGQVLALSINVRFSAAGKLPTGLGGMHIASGPLAGKTVNEVLALANDVLGGCKTPAQAGVASISAMSDIATAINENFDGGANKGFLIP